MQTILVVVHIFVAVALIGLVLIQHGKGADAGAAFGSGASATVFGARGSANFLSRTTGILAAVFFLTSLIMAYFAMQGSERQGLMAGVEQPAAQPAPTVPPAAVPAAEVPAIAPPAAPASPAESAVPVVEKADAPQAVEAGAAPVQEGTVQGAPAQESGAPTTQENAKE